MSVTPAAVAAAPEPGVSMFARLLPLPREAHAQNAASCTPPGGGLLTFFVEAPGLDDVSVFEIVESVGCTFDALLRLPPGDHQLTIGFLDDVNGNVAEDEGEDRAVLLTSRTFRNRDQVLITNVHVDFTTGTATGTITVEGEETPMPMGTATPTLPPGTPTPTATPYEYGASLNQPPSTMFAMLLGLGVAVMLLPLGRRRRS